MKKANFILYTFFILFCSNVVNAQSKQNNKSVPNIISTQISEGKTFQKYDIFETNNSIIPNAKITKIVDKYSILSLKNDGLQQLVKEKQNRIEFTVSDATGRSYNLLLYKVNLFTSDFKVSTSDLRSNMNYSTGIHYRGIIANNYNSIVAISFIENEVMGIINNGATQLILGKLEGNTTNHILYFENDLKVSSNFSCGTVASVGTSYSLEDLTYSKTEKMEDNDCLSVYIEVDNDIFLDKGTTTGFFITGLFNQSATIFANDGITLVLSEIFIWDTSHNYAGACSRAVLEGFQAFRTSFNGDIGHLVSYDNLLGGIAAGFNAICNSDIAETMCFSGIHGMFETVPIYSWNVMVFTHEMGHLLGSRHTHACVWNGNNTAIDGCGSCQEEPNPPPSPGGCALSGIDCNFCPRPPSPANGGTIMSYCHLDPVGINFSLGFGPQPTAVMLNNIANASCTFSCGSCPTDLTLTGTETVSVTYFATNSITSSQTIESTANVQYLAGNSIIMSTGFFAENGSILETTIGFVCDTDGTVGTNSISTPNPNEPTNNVQPTFRKTDIVTTQDDFKLSVNPNPFNGSTTIIFELQQETEINLTVYDINGIKIKQLAGGRFEKGVHEIIWETRHQAPGVYLAKLIYEDKFHTAKLILSK